MIKFVVYDDEVEFRNMIKNSIDDVMNKLDLDYKIELFDKYNGVYQTVISNIIVRPEFCYLNARLKEMNEERVAKIGAVRAQVALEASRDQIMGDYNSSSQTQDRVRNMWNDTIKELDEYKTLDGKRLKTSMFNETVAQDGDTYYIGNKTGIPSGFKELSKSY